MTLFASEEPRVPGHHVDCTCTRCHYLRKHPQLLHARAAAPTPTEHLGGIPMDPICPRCGKRHGIEVSGDGYEWDCKACGGHLVCAIGLDGGEMFPWHTEDGGCGCPGEPHTCGDDDELSTAEAIEIEGQIIALATKIGWHWKRDRSNTELPSMLDELAALVPE